MRLGFIAPTSFAGFSLFFCSKTTAEAYSNFWNCKYFLSTLQPLSRFYPKTRVRFPSNVLHRCLRAARNVQVTLSDRITVGIAICILSGIVLNRFLTSELTIAQERSDLLGVIFSVLSLVHVLWKQDFSVKEEAPEILVGKDYREINVHIDRQSLSKLEHLCRWIQEATYAKSIVIQQGDFTLVRWGPGKDGQQVHLGELAMQCLASGKASFLADLKIVAGRSEFNYMSSNCKSIYMEPLAKDTLLILGSGKVRPFTETDLTWIRATQLQLAQLLTQEETRFLRGNDNDAYRAE
ncbi:hypothetical protein GAYE_SCF27MG4669 [Galdieria yellowstonensis]|uniref:Uncharacterized protein n=1 Tax=Galdieria yellowstonensis TaxID=3028027 RepID=A0AAV9IH11_9RHOD|nr:hypothetical protein GAYE_SCF27MG4669 [Galdieria yellowstonensis]